MSLDIIIKDGKFDLSILRSRAEETIHYEEEGAKKDGSTITDSWDVYWEAKATLVLIDAIEATYLGNPVDFNNFLFSNHQMEIA